MLAGFASNPWDYASAPKPRSGGEMVTKPWSNSAVSNLLQAPHPVPMGQAVDNQVGAHPAETTHPPITNGIVAGDEVQKKLLENQRLYELWKEYLASGGAMNVQPPPHTTRPPIQTLAPRPLY